MSRLTLKELQDIYWRQLMILLGHSPEDDRQQDLVRLAYQEDSQPFHDYHRNICYYYVQAADDPINRQIDTRYNPIDDTKTQQINSYNRVITLDIILYGSDAYDRAVLLRMDLLEPTQNWDLAAKGLYIIPDIAEPQQMWEPYNNKYWPRVDMQVRYNNLVTDERHTVNYLSSADIAVVSEQTERVIEVKEGE